MWREANATPRAKFTNLTSTAATQSLTQLMSRAWAEEGVHVEGGQMPHPEQNHTSNLDIGG